MVVEDAKIISHNSACVSASYDIKSDFKLQLEDIQIGNKSLCTERIASMDSSVPVRLAGWSCPPPHRAAPLRDKWD